MIIKGIEHVSISVSDIDKATKFYRDILGFKHLETVEDGPKDLVYFDIAGKSRLELFYSRGEALKPIIPESEHEPLGYVHLAFMVDDVDSWAKHFEKHNVPIVFGPIDLPQLSMRVCLFEDPDGNVLEICVPI